MDNAAEKAVERVIAAMHDNLGEQLTIDDMARVAMFSKFHFSRIFQRVTGVSPGRFLSALRLAQAKELLTSTSFNVSDISLRVGYTSVGTFSSRFTRSVGLSPTTYRRLRGIAPRIQSGTDLVDPTQATGMVRGLLTPADPDKPGLTFIGLFHDRIPEGRPVSCAVLAEPGPFLLDKVPPGSWYLLAHSVAESPEQAVEPSSLRGVGLAAATVGPLTVGQSDIVENADLHLRPMRSLDPPVLLALLDVRKTAMARVGRAPQRYPLAA
ncbi:AraC family transcriptional regulator [Micromonospora sp. R77]|uniref:helix-turn-helix domain-containing protein n=1 Tax=Micromonospora sp. R77 TaxID=2925836 RepID=UPI001F60A498|nr:AraC family transcriptional regulator [Micromonospora sp. R77]MCI4061213.1 AraC family transcriptional regulator [Micromonospora sp. R77]